MLAPTLLHEISGAAHAPYYEKAEQFNQLLLTFLETT
jgi:pimeloyl-ACP methyl ester carboxylesterase